MLLKDIGDLVAEDNDILANRVGIYAEGVPSNPCREAIFTGNVIAGNEVGLALQSNAALTMTGNRIAENLTDVRPLGTPALRRHALVARRARQFVGPVSRASTRTATASATSRTRSPDAMDALVRRNPLVQAFLYTPAHLALEAAARMFPIYRQAPGPGRRSPADDAIRRAEACDDRDHERHQTLRTPRRAVGACRSRCSPGKSPCCSAPNGAGKSTLLRCLLGITDFDGDIRSPGSTR